MESIKHKKQPQSVVNIKIWKDSGEYKSIKPPAKTKGELLKEYKELKEDLGSSKTVKSTRYIRLTLFSMIEKGLDIYNKADYRKIRATRVYNKLEDIAEATGREIEEVIKDLNCIKV